MPILLTFFVPIILEGTFSWHVLSTGESTINIKYGSFLILTERIAGPSGSLANRIKNKSRNSKSKLQ